MPFESYHTWMPGFATSIELVSDIPPVERFTESIELREEALFLVATLTLPNGQQPLWDLGRLELKSNNYFGEPQENADVYVNEHQTVFVLNGKSSADTHWNVSVIPGAIQLPVAVNFMAFHGRGSAVSLPPLILPSGLTFKCRGCKITAKALALAIIAAGTLAAIPSALIAAVAAYLGAGAAVAGVFIGSVLGDTADVIAEKLCKMIGMC